MADTKFDAKSFNSEAFGFMVGRAPNLRLNEIRKSRALSGNPDIRRLLDAQNGTEYARIAMRGLIGGDPVKYDGKTDIPSTSTKTFERGVVVIGHAQAWVERDFSYDITGGIDFMQNIANQVSEHQSWIDMQSIYATLRGIFAMTGVNNTKFTDSHTHDISEDSDPYVGPTTLNTAMNKALGDNKKRFSLVFVHSDVATRLENLNLVDYKKYTAESTIQGDPGLATWNGRLVVIDDGLPFDETSGKYTSYILGAGSLEYEDVGARVPFEMDRNPSKYGGEDYLYMRQRKVFAPFGVSYERKSQSSLSPDWDELASGENWSLAHTGEAVAAKREYFNHKAIPIARIISKG